MVLEFEQEDVSGRETIKVFGVGGGGGNAINRMIATGQKGVTFVALNTDGQALGRSQADIRIQLGERLTKTFGAGGKPEIGEKAAMESRDDIAENLKGTDMVFITAGMGGGTGTGAAPIIAEVAKELGVLSVGIVTRPFVFEGQRRAEAAEEGIRRLREHVDALITIPNEKLLQIVDKNTSIADAFKKADEVLTHGVRGIIELVRQCGIVNLDFQDITSVIKDGGDALMGIGEAEGDERATEAAKKAISSPLLEIPFEGARNVLYHISAGMPTMMEVNAAASLIREAAAPDAYIFFGQNMDESLGDTLRITVIATGFGPKEVISGGKKKQPGRGTVGQGGGDSEIEIEPWITRSPGRGQPQARRPAAEKPQAGSDLPPFLQGKNNIFDQ